MTSRADFQIFGVREVNPFLGVRQILETPVGRATSASGVHWDIAIRTERARVLGVLERDVQGRAYIRFGLWSQAAGHSIANSRRLLTQDEELREKSELLVEVLMAQSSRLPFPLVDREELWLFDADDERPVALLAARIPGQVLPMSEPRSWRASYEGVGTPAQQPFVDGRQLEEQVKRRAGYNAKRRWVLRLDDGGGVCRDSGEQLSASQFPGLLLTRDWDRAAEAEVIERYLGWTAPALLTLPGISDSDRIWLETRLHLQATAVEHHCELYPKVISPKRIKSALVQSRLETAP